MLYHYQSLTIGRNIAPYFYKNLQKLNPSTGRFLVGLYGIEFTQSHISLDHEFAAF